MGERAPVALLSAPASGRLAVAEAVTNILAADIESLAQIRLSANWMAACGEPGEDAALYQTVRAVGEELCPALGIAIPVGKDSLSMKTTWREGQTMKSVVAPVSLIVSAFAPVADVRRTLTPVLRCDRGATALWLIDLGRGRNRLGASALLRRFTLNSGQNRPISTMRRSCCGSQLRLRNSKPRSWCSPITIAPTADSSRRSSRWHSRDIAVLRSSLPAARGAALEQLFAEELGAVIQVRAADEARVAEVFARYGFAAHAFRIGAPLTRATHGANSDLRVRIEVGALRFDESWSELRRAWSETSWQMRRLRDAPACADEEFAACADSLDAGLSVALAFDPEEDIAAPYIARGIRPPIAILREEGVNSQVETAAVFERAGFEPHDVHMTDLLDGRRSLAEFKGVVACGGFSYGDVLGAGEGWAKSILFHAAVREEFLRFFARADSFALGICNGCQMFAALKSLIPGTAHWPRFVRNAASSTRRALRYWRS